MLLLLLLLLAASSAVATGSSLREAWNKARERPSETRLFMRCAISSDSVTLNGIQCPVAGLSFGIGCLDTRKGYACLPNAGAWTIFSQ